MFARPFVGFVALALPLVVGAMAALAQSPTPTPLPTATASSATPTPFVTPVGCGFFASPTPATGLPPNPSAPGSPAVPTDLRAELVDDPELASGFAVHLTWQDNADNETCFGVAVRIQGALIGVIGLSPGLDGSTTGPMTLKHVPVFTGPFCYQVYYGNGAGQSYSNEACINVEVLPVWATATPMPPTVETPMPSPTQPPMPSPTPPWPTPLPPQPQVLEGAPLGCHWGAGPSVKAPSPPANVRASYQPGASPGAWNVLLAWDDLSDNEACFIIERSQAAAGPWQPVGFAEADSKSWTDVAVPSGTLCYQVYPANAYGRSEAPSFCLPPRALPATGGGHEGAALAWWWWPLAAAGSAGLGLAALSLVRLARRRHLSPSR